MPWRWRFFVLLAGSFFITSLVTGQTSVAFRDSINRLFATGHRDTAIVEGLNALAATFPLAKSDSVLKYTKQALALANEMKYGKGAGHALFIESTCYRVTGDFATALQKGLQCFNVYQKGGFVKEAAAIEIELAQLYKDMTSDKHTTEYINTGIMYSKSAYNHFQQTKDTSGMVLSLNLSGILFRDKAINSQRYFYDSAFQCYTRAFLLIDRSLHGREYYGKLSNNISQVYLEYKKDYKTALQYLFKALKFNTDENRKSSLSFNYGNIARAYSALADHKNAIKFARLMLNATLEENAPARIEDSYLEMYEAFNAASRYDSALHYFKMKDSLGNVLNNLAKSQQVMNLQVKYETANKELEIVRLNKEAYNQKRRIIFLGIIVVCIVAVSGFMFWLYRRIRFQKQQIALQSQRLEVVMKELHHRVKNNLQIVSSLLSLQSYKLHDHETISVLKESQQRVQAMSLIHQKLYNQETLTAVNMKEYITDLAESLVASYGFAKEDFELNIIIEKEMLDVEKALPIGLLINEMVTNALKYAFSNIQYPCLTIQLSEEPDGLTLVVKDNGAGIDLQKWNQKGSSFGKQLIGVLSKQLRAQQNLSVKNGTNFTIVIPATAA